MSQGSLCVIRSRRLGSHSALCKDVEIELVNHNGLEHLSSFTTKNMNRIRSFAHDYSASFEEHLWRSNARSQKLEDFDVKQLYEVDLGMYIWCDSTTSTNRHLEVEGCIEIKEIFSGSTNTVSPILPNLKKLILIDMPQLRSILVRNSIEWPSLQRLKIHGCPKLKRLPLKKDGVVKLTSIEAEKSWWEALENDQEVTDKFQRYCTLM
ncbi:NB-ARC domains-containing protein [Tanacetum coccineum]